MYGQRPQLVRRAPLGGDGASEGRQSLLQSEGAAVQTVPADRQQARLQTDLRAEQAGLAQEGGRGRVRSCGDVI